VSTTTRLFNAGLDLLDDRTVAQPYLAEALPQLNTDSWRVLPDGRMETVYHLRPNLAWHDGRPLTAEDFVFSWRVYSTPELGSAGAPPLSYVEEITAADARTLVLRWRQSYPQAGVMARGSGSSLPPLPRHMLEASFQEGQWDGFLAQPFWTREFNGLGPYKLDRWDSGASLEGVAFDGHILGRARIERIQVLFFGDSNTALASLMSGAIEMAADNAMSFDQGIAIKREWAAYNGGTLLLTPNNWRAVYAQLREDLVRPRALTDVRVRKALAHAIDRQALGDTTFEGEGRVADTFLSPFADYAAIIDRSIVKYAYDPRRTEQLMAEAGISRLSDGHYVVTGGDRFTFEVKTNAQAQNEKERSILAAAWREAGYEVEEAGLPASLGQDGQARSTFTGLYSFSTPLGENALDNFTSVFIPRPENRWTGNNRGAWSNAAYDRLMEAFNTTLQREERTQQLVQLARIVSDEVPAISLFYDQGPTPHVAALKGPGPVSNETTGKVAWNVHTWELN